MNKDELKRMTAAERIKAMEMLWDVMLHDDQDIPSPAWHEEVLKKRRESIVNGSAKFISLSELKSM